MMPRITLDLELLRKFKQEHLLRFVGSLDADARIGLEEQLESIDFELIANLASGQDETPDWATLADRAVAPTAIRLGETEPKFSREMARGAGEAALRAGKFGMILVAGGQGTRLGFDFPKGMFPIAPISGRTLFQMHVDRLLGAMRRYNVSIPMYIMTSPATDCETRRYFDQQNRCGLRSDQLRIFCQSTMPAIDQQTGQILMSGPGEIALSPDGHGGLVAALEANGCIQDAKQRGLEHFFYAQVDNPIVQICDPKLIGYHLLDRSQMTTQVVNKRFAKERVGNVVAIDGRVQIIEYSDLPDRAAEQLNADGSLKLWAGNIAVHVFELAFLESVIASAHGLPFHRALKAVPFINATGELIKPTTLNAIKFERFIFDLLPLADRALVVEADAARAFAPVKNANGAATDTPDDARQAIAREHCRWLTQAGAVVKDRVVVEIHPSWALDEHEAKEKIPRGLVFESNTFLC